MINQKKKENSNEPQFNKTTTPKAVCSQLSPLFVNNIQTEPSKNDSNTKRKMASTIMYTQLPGKINKENIERVPSKTNDFVSVPSNPNIRTQPYSFTKGSQPNGFISYS